MDIRRTVARQWWTLERFGLTPGRLVARLAGGYGPRVFCVSLPKAGTHLLERALCLHPCLYRKLVPTVVERDVGRVGRFEGLVERIRPGQVLVSHLPFRPDYPGPLASHDVRPVFLVRDPRDIVVARAFASLRHPGPSRRQLVIGQAAPATATRLRALFARNPNLDARIGLFVQGDSDNGLPSITQALERYAGWLESGALVVRFEDLIGPAGGGDAAIQTETLRRIFQYLGLDRDDELVRSIAGRLVSPASPTFRRGSTGEWRRHFDTELEDRFDRAAGALAVRYGY